MAGMDGWYNGIVMVVEEKNVGSKGKKGTEEEYNLLLCKFVCTLQSLDPHGHGHVVIDRKSVV